MCSSSSGSLAFSVSLDMIYMCADSFWLCFLVLTGQSDEPVPENVKQVELRVPRTAGLQCVWSLSDYSPCRLLSLPATLFGYRSQTTLGLWMLSVCLAEIEKHKGNGFIGLTKLIDRLM